MFNLPSPISHGPKFFETKFVQAALNRGKSPSSLRLEKEQRSSGQTKDSEGVFASHSMACRLCAFLSRSCEASYNLKRPWANMVRRTDESMGFVRQSAACNVVGTHRKVVFSEHRSFISKTSKVVLNSSQEGMAKRVTKSNKDLQSVMIAARLS